LALSRRHQGLFHKRTGKNNVQRLGTAFGEGKRAEGKGEPGNRKSKIQKKVGQLRPTFFNYFFTFFANLVCKNFAS
jgi:hypothetical protein